MDLTVRTAKAKQVIDITDKVEEVVKNDTKSVSVFVAHTTCAVTIADLDPGAAEDLIAAVWAMIPKLDYSRHHDPEHFPAHIAAAVIGPSVSIPVKDGKMTLGTWQRVVLVELDGPRERQLYLTLT